ncbi:DUF6223 family protein [Amycolatopsis decaplanina]|uniref:Uncharacterized protein n=1 Tax=Amycolatopsis decaplanina DSM 44594 TaxID=1284240 RepID=M2YIT3_9PSEU|nr:DUF6223 family protein [Amycolatopsis decaplanina]EME61695.1 hypothetical protein H074_11000 [Amycolatopsis decaplanina DSM 44594]
MSVHLLSEPIAAAYLTPGRLWSLVAALAGVIGVIVGGLALARHRSGNTRRGAVVALTAGLLGMAGGGFVVAAAEGGPGTGYGIVGGYIALVIGLLAAILGWLALSRSRRTA